ncbi:MAG: ABC transporter substrate-binding protein [Pirellulaceae bacterium]|jgi:peptide/nickel transport system substrate-binding protein|nr:ABC transporter substrate-binding protein [Pirellulaceae bacterium]
MNLESIGLKRRFSTGMLVLFVGLMAVAMVACGDEDEPSSSGGSTSPTATTAPSGGTAPTAAPAQPTAVPTPEPPVDDRFGGTLTFAYFRAPTSPDGYQSSGGYENFFIWTNNEPILVMDTGGGVDQEASLASAFEVLDDGLRIRFTIREGVEFQGGLGTMTAEDVAWSLNRWFEEGSLGCRGCSGGFSKAKEAVVVNPATVDLIMNELDANIIVKLMGRETIIHSQKHWEAVGGQDDHKSQPIGTGAYKLTDWQVGTSIDYERHDDWWRGKPFADEVKVITISETRTRLAALQTGQANVAFLQSEMIPAARKDDKIDVWAGGYGIEGWRWNPALAPLNDIRVRRALIKAVDREALNTSVYLDSMNINTSCILAPGPLAVDCSDLWETDWFGFDIDGAKALIEEYAADTGQTLPLIMKGAVERRPDRQQLNEFLQGSWLEIGVDYTFETTTNVSASSDVMAKCETHQQSTGSGIVAQRQLEGNYHSRGSGNYPRRCAEEGNDPYSPEDQAIQDQLDDLLDQAAATVDEATRAALYNEADKLGTKYAFATFPLMNRQNFFGCNNTITGGCGNEDDGLNINRGEGFFRQEDFWVKK